MKKIFLLLTALYALNSSNAQPCFPEGITLTTQGQINNFRINNPGCTQIEGDLTISGYTITNLLGLNMITAIGGSLNIECNEALASLAGLENLTHIGGNLYLAGNLVLPDLTGLNGLTFVGGDIQLADNVAIVNLTGLEGLTSINEQLCVSANAALSNLNGLNNVVSIAVCMRIFSNPALANLTGLESLAYIGGNLKIGGVDHLGGIGNPSLASLTALQNLTSVMGEIEIAYNPMLTSLSGLDNINSGTITDMSVYDNITLSECETAGICNYLGNPNGTVYISNNAPGCNSMEEVQAACLLLDIEKANSMNGLRIFPNPSSGNITIETGVNQSTSLVSVVNVNGTALIRSIITGGTAQINVTSLPSGVYLVRITGERDIYTGRFVKQ
jgi:hypothetical protein